MMKSIGIILCVSVWLLLLLGCKKAVTPTGETPSPGTTTSTGTPVAAPPDSAAPVTTPTEGAAPVANPSQGAPVAAPPAEVRSGASTPFEKWWNSASQAERDKWIALPPDEKAAFRDKLRAGQ